MGIFSCGEDKYLNRPADQANCTIGAKQPNYWYQLERNNVCALRTYAFLYCI
jgi:hypothetical protein